jgi:hypothetical protein
MSARHNDRAVLPLVLRMRKAQPSAGLLAELGTDIEPSDRAASQQPRQEREDHMARHTRQPKRGPPAPSANVRSRPEEAKRGGVPAR